MQFTATAVCGGLQNDMIARVQAGPMIGTPVSAARCAHTARHAQWHTVRP